VLTYSMNLMGQPDYAAAILGMVRDADVGIEALRRKEVSTEQFLSNLPKGIPDGLREFLATTASHGLLAVIASHRRFDPEGKEAELVEFDFQSEESAGTQKLVAMSGHFLQTLREGRAGRNRPDLADALRRGIRSAGLSGCLFRLFLEPCCR